MLKKIGVVVCCVFVVVCFAQKTDKKKVKHKKANASLYGNFTEDPKEQQLFQIKRLRNPATGKIPIDIRNKELTFSQSLPKKDENSRANTTWQSRGPNNLGGRTRAIALDVTNENIILAGQASGGMWRSEDGGLHFTKTTLPSQLHSATCVVQDTRPGKTNIWYHGTGETYGIVNAAGFSSQRSGNGIFKSMDGGRSWNQLSSTVSNTPTTMLQKRDFDFVWEIVVNHTNLVQDEIYAAVANGVWRSVDGGNSWTAVLGLDSTFNSVSEYTDLAITSTGVLYATISSETPSKGIWRSTDGINWVNITPSTFPANYNRIEMGIAPSNESLIYFIVEYPNIGTTGHGLYKYNYLTGDGAGANGSWTNLTANIPDEHCLGFYTFDFAKFNSQNSYDLYVKVSPTDTNTVFLGGTNIYRNTDGWSTPNYTWIGGYQCDTAKISNYVYPNHHPDQHKMLFLPSNPNIVITGSDGGIHKTNNILAPTVSWQSLNNWYNTGQFYTCAIEPGNATSNIIVGGLQDNGTLFTNTTDYYKPWKNVFYGDGSYCAVAHNRSNYYLSYQSGKVFKFAISDSGVINGLQRIDPLGAGSNYQFIDPFILDPTNDSIMYLTAGKYIYRNDSLYMIPLNNDEYSAGNIGWKRINSTYTGAGFTAPSISTLDMSITNPNVLFYGTDKGQLFRIDSAKIAVPTKVNITSTLFPVGAYVACVEVDNRDENKVLVAFSNYSVKSIFYSEDKGLSWADVSGNLEQNPDGTGNGPSVAWVHTYFDGTKNIYYAGTSIGLFSTETLDGPNTIWTQEGASTIGNVVINMITSRSFDNTIVVATHGGGMYSNKIFTPNGIAEINKEKEKIMVQPNPFSTEINIVFYSMTSENKTIKISDVTGKIVFEKEVKSTAGENFLAIPNLSELNNGAYFLQIGNATKVLLKK